MSDTEQPLSEAAVRDMLARAEAATPGPFQVVAGELGYWNLRDVNGAYVGSTKRRRDAEVFAAARTDLPALARECLRLRALLAEAAGALGLLGAGIVPHRRHWPTELPFVEGCPGCEHNKQLDAAAAVAARVRAHLHPTETPE